MKTDNSPFVVAIASLSGGGKTTAVDFLVNHLRNAKALYFDNYDFAGPDDLLEWLERGADYNEWNLHPLLLDLEEMLSEPLDFIFLDFPFANRHMASRKYIDFTVFIDTPLDLALSRRLMRDFADASKEEMLADILFYAKKGRAAYLQMLKDIKPVSNLVTDGSVSIEEIGNEVMIKIEQLHNEYYRRKTR